MKHRRPPDTLPIIVSLSPTLEQSYCVPLTRGHWLSAEPPANSGTGPLQLRPQECGTVCRLTYETQSCHTPGSGGRWRRFYFDSPTTAHCEIFFFFKLRRVEIFVLTYVLTPLAAAVANSLPIPWSHFSETANINSLTRRFRRGSAAVRCNSTRRRLGFRSTSLSTGLVDRRHRRP